MVRAHPISGQCGESMSKWKVDVEGDDNIWRQDDAGRVIVTGAVFVKLAFFDQIGQDDGVSYREDVRMFDSF